MNELKKEQSYKSMLLFGMFSIVMLFAGLTSAYIVSKGFFGANWDSVNFPRFKVSFFPLSEIFEFKNYYVHDFKLFEWSTVTIICSSIFLYLSCAKENLKRTNKLVSKGHLLVSFILGLCFLFLQFLGWKVLISNNIFFVGTSNAASYIYIFTGLHLAHVIFGLLFLLQSIFKNHFSIFSSESFLALKLKHWFWHFLAFLWIYLYCFLSVAK